MKTKTKRWSALLAGILLILTALPVFAEEGAQTLLPAMALPEATGGAFADITLEEDPLVGPHGGNYLRTIDGTKIASGYADPSITVVIGQGRFNKTNYIYARIKIANPNQFRFAMAEDSLEKNKTTIGSKLAKRVNAVISINGVLEADYKFKGPVVKDGNWLRPDPVNPKASLEKWKKQEARDTLVIDKKGDMHILREETWGDVIDRIKAMGDEVANAFVFGPALILDGERQKVEYERGLSTTKPAQRVALCQMGELEYMIITSEGPEDPGSTGLKLWEFAELLETFGEIQQAYNLDGGSSSTLNFKKGNSNWGKINCPKNNSERPLRDIIYFADAWIPNKK